MTYSVSRHEQRLVSGAQLVKKSVGQFLTASPEFTYIGQHTVSNFHWTPAPKKINIEILKMTIQKKRKGCRYGGLWSRKNEFIITVGPIIHSLVPTIGECVDRLASIVECCQTGALWLSGAPSV